MVKPKLKQLLAKEKAYQKQEQAQKSKSSKNAKKSKQVVATPEDDDDEEEELDYAALAESDSNSESDISGDESDDLVIGEVDEIEEDDEDISELDDDEIERELEQLVSEDDEDEEEEEEEEDEEDIPLSEAELDDDADVIPHRKVTIYNKAALLQSHENISLPYKNLKFMEHMSVNALEPLKIKDIYDDTERELAFYQQGLDAVKLARSQLIKEKVPFTRPTDYFAEMVKSDEHMDKIRDKLVQAETDKRNAQEARRQRELKKFGKKVQHAKLQERAKERKENLEKVKGLKKKRANNEISADDFDIAIEEAAANKQELRESRDNKRHKPNAKRQAKNEKYGNGGRKRHSKSNDSLSSGDLSGMDKKRSARGAPAPKRRLGKSRRK